MSRYPDFGFTFRGFAVSVLSEVMVPGAFGTCTAY
jgi:hypothetical protein